MQNLSDYKKKIVSRYIPIEGNHVNKDLPDSDEFYFSEKIDGNLALAITSGDSTTFFNRSGTEISLPSLSNSFPKSANGVWAGELYTNKERSHFFDVASAIVNDKENLNFAIFDAVHLLDKSVIERIKAVQAAIPFGDKIHPVNWTKVETKKEVLETYNDLVSKGKEGVVVHTGLGSTYKIKPSLNLDLAVLGYSMKEDGSGLRALLVGAMHPEGHWQILASVGGGFSDDDRILWLSKLAAIETQADFVMVATNRLAYKWVKPYYVIQIKCLEILNEDSNGTIYKEIVKYDETSGYASNGKTPGVSIYSPIMLGVREDKKPSVEDTGINQITDRVELLADEKPDLEELPDSTLLKKEIYTKNAKTGTAVRKFIVLKTNKTFDQGFPPYLLYYTDFSAGRKDPLQTDIKIASSEEQVLEFFLKSIEENVKKGWDKIG